MAGAEALVFLLVAVAVLAAFGLRYDVPAEEVHVSGVLAVVTAGVYIGTRSLELSHAGARLRTLIDVDEARVRSRGR